MKAKVAVMLPKSSMCWEKLVHNRLRLLDVIILAVEFEYRSNMCIHVP